MTDVDVLFRELKPDVEKISLPLFEFARQQVRKRGAFLPFGSALRGGVIALYMGGPESDETSSVEALPILHGGLREAAADAETTVVAVCEWVKITLDDGSATDAIKVLVEHKRGLVVALYLPSRRGFFGWRFGEMFVLPAQSEVKAWETA